MLAKDIKIYLKRTFLKQYKGDVYSELFTDTTIADIAVLGDNEFVGIEIKSKSDSLKRFVECQQWGYTYFFDMLWLVVDKKHADRALELLESDRFNLNPDPWGLLVIGPRGGMKVLRAPSINTERKDLYLTKRLWREDLVEELKARNFKGYSKLSCAKMRRELLKLLAPGDLRPLIRKYIKQHMKINKERPRRS